MPEKKKRQIVYNISTNFKVERLLGEGAYGVVCLATHKPSGTKVAIKKINAFTNKLVALRTLREMTLLKRLQNENIISLLDVQVPPSFEEFNEVYLVQEYMNSDLHKIIQHQHLSDDHVQYFSYQILRGLKFIHSANVIHRDLKPSNILVNNNCDLKICDLGLSRLNLKYQGASISNLTEYVATRWYRAPEIMLSASKYSFAVDIWSVGCILGEMFIGLPLFPGKDYKNQLTLIFNLLGNPMNNIDDFNCISSLRAKKFISTLSNTLPLNLPEFFQKHPHRRSMYGKLKINPQGIDLLEKLLVFDPEKRLTIHEALKHSYVSLYHDQTDEPVTNPISPDDFDFDKDKSELSMSKLKYQLYDTLVNFHS